MTNTSLHPPDLYFRVRGAGWDARLLVNRPEREESKPTQFTVPWLDTLRVVQAHVRYTDAINERPGWTRWHIKIYECTSEPEARALLTYLRKQTTVVAKANRALAGRRPVDPPWGIVPVYVHYAADDRERADGTVYTSLGGATDEVLTPAGFEVPDWFAATAQDAKRMVIAASPYVEKIAWEAYVDDAAPATEHLGAFRSVARALDAIHLNNMIHSDIKPDNVQNVVWADNSAYALIDTDSVTDIGTVPFYLRTTPPYVYAGIGDVWRLRATGSPDAEFTVESLRAHDRFCFALVVLSALAGRGWVIETLLSADSDPVSNLPRYAERQIEDAGLIAASLSDIWPDARWGPFIERLVEPFGPRAIVVEEWRAEVWIERLIAATQAGPGGSTDEVPPRYREAFTRIQRAANTGAAAARVSRGLFAIHEETVTLARAARRRLTRVVAVLTVLVVVACSLGVWKK